jgi:hypothetical protein
MAAMDYLLRNVPPDLWRHAKAAAALKGMTIRELLLSCLRELAEASADEQGTKAKKSPSRQSRS